MIDTGDVLIFLLVKSRFSLTFSIHDFNLRSFVGTVRLVSLKKWKGD